MEGDFERLGYLSISFVFQSDRRQSRDSLESIKKYSSFFLIISVEKLGCSSSHRYLLVKKL